MQTRINSAGQVIGFTAIPAEYCEEFWPNVREYADRALQYAFEDLTPEDILRDLISDNKVLVVITLDAEIKAALIVQIDVLKAGKNCCVMLAGGEDMLKWTEEWLGIWEEIAREQGCRYLTLKGREGWARYARRFGFKHGYTQMYKELTEVNNG